MTSHSKKKKDREVLYLYIDASLKRWLTTLCKKQPGRVSKSTMVNSILTAAKIKESYETKV